MRATKMSVTGPNQALWGSEGRFLARLVTPSAIVISMITLHLSFNLPTLPGSLLNSFLALTVPHTEGWIRASQKPRQHLYCHFRLHSTTPNSVR